VNEDGMESDLLMDVIFIYHGHSEYNWNYILNYEVKLWTFFWNCTIMINICGLDRSYIFESLYLNLGLNVD
jgi:hypothetical protein